MNLRGLMQRLLSASEESQLCRSGDSEVDVIKIQLTEASQHND